jgi:hypothetical protein
MIGAGGDTQTVSSRQKNRKRIERTKPGMLPGFVWLSGSR